jgi:hypothetical protein
MQKIYTIGITVTGKTKENEQAFGILADEAFETLRKSVEALNNTVTVQVAIQEGTASVEMKKEGDVTKMVPIAPAPAPPKA